MSTEPKPVGYCSEACGVNDSLLLERAIATIFYDVLQFYKKYVKINSI